MKKFKVRYALGGGFGGVEMTEPEILEFETLAEAENYAYERACEEYESYEGLHGLRNVSQIMEEENVDEDEAESIYRDEKEGWLDYDAIELKENKE